MACRQSPQTRLRRLRRSLVSLAPGPLRRIAPPEDAARVEAERRIIALAGDLDRDPKPNFLLQLCFYSEQVARSQGRKPVLMPGTEEGVRR